jgi:hypothetical protein
VWDVIRKRYQLIKALNISPKSALIHVGRAANYSLSGREEEARAEVAEVLRINPKFSLGYFQVAFHIKTKPIGNALFKY